MKSAMITAALLAFPASGFRAPRLLLQTPHARAAPAAATAAAAAAASRVNVAALSSAVADRASEAPALAVQHEPWTDIPLGPALEWDMLLKNGEVETVRLRSEADAEHEGARVSALHPHPRITPKSLQREMAKHWKKAGGAGAPPAYVGLSPPAGAPLGRARGGASRLATRAWCSTWRSPLWLPARASACSCASATPPHRTWCSPRDRRCAGTRADLEPPRDRRRQDDPLRDDIPGERVTSESEERPAADFHSFKRL